MSEDNSSSEKTPGHFVAKIVATVFATILAPLFVGVGIRYLSPSEKPPPVPEQNKPAENKPAENRPPIVLTVGRPGPLHFNGKDLSGFNTYITGRGRDQDPRRVFTVSGGVLRISGEDGGYLATKHAYERYALHAEYRWGEKTWKERESRVRMSGISVHAESEGLLEVASKGSYYVYLKEGGTGDIGLRPGDLSPCQLTAEIDPAKPKGSNFYYLPKGPKATITAQAWLMGLNHAPDFKDVKGFRGAKDWEKPTGEWNSLDVVCGPGTLTVMLNGRTVNAASQLNRARGKILFHSNQAEIFFRKIDVIPAEK